MTGILAPGEVLIVRQAHFNAAHRLHNPTKSDEWNRETFGRCNSPNWHGHNYLLEVGVAGVPDADTGYLIDLSDLRKIIEREIVEPCDHRNLNIEVEFLKGIMPSTENLVIAFWKQLQSSLVKPRLFVVRLWETERNRAEYFGP
jgi:6-pyruvoyltetrahydropterin/6-carboxytetrahydropterin synthase